MKPLYTAALAAVGAFAAVALAGVTMFAPDPTVRLVAVDADRATVTRLTDGSSRIDTKLCLDGAESATVTASVTGPGSVTLTDVTDAERTRHGSVVVTQACVSDLGGPRSSSEYYGPGGTPVRLGFTGTSPAGYDHLPVRFTYTTPDSPTASHVDVEYPAVR